MRFRKALAVLLSVSIIFSAFAMVIVYADGEAAEQYTDVSEDFDSSDPSTDVPPEETPDDPPAETPDETPEETPDEPREETPDESKFDPAAAYEELMALETEEEIEAFLAALTDEEYAALEAYISAAAGSEGETPITVPFTDAGPILPAITLEGPGTPPAGLSVQTGEQNEVPMDGEEDALLLDKTADENGDGTYSVTLEAFTTGQVTSVTQSVPCDIILVLDQSGSMKYDFDGNSTGDNTKRRQYAMKQAVCAFIADVADRYTEEGNHRIGVVTFASSSSTLIGLTYTTENDGEAELTGVINGLPNEPSGATNVSAGMAAAKTIFDGDTVAGTRQRVVIVFTDGVPTTSTEFDIGVANGAISTGKALKDGGVTIYTIGIFNGADKDVLHGEFINGSNSWLSSDEVSAANRFMNYLSGNYPLAENVGIIKEYKRFGFLNWHNVFTITASYDRVDNDLNYYLTANSQDTLDDIFTSISTQISTPNITLGTNAVVRDVISPYFDMPETEDVAVYTADYLGGGGWASPVAAAGIDVDINDETCTVDVSGFNFDGNYVTETAREGFFGRKLIIVITLSPKSGFAGGNLVPTNTDTSGIYTAPDAALPIETFPVPTVDVPISFDFLTNDKSIYLLGSVTTADLYTAVNMSGWQYDFVEPASYMVSAVISNTASGSYTITATVSPKYEGTYTDAAVAHGASVHVFFPKVTYKDSTIYLGQSPDYNVNFVSLVWSCTDGALIQSPSGSAPVLSYAYTPGAAPFACETKIQAAVCLSDTNITEYVIFAWQNDTGCGCTQAPAGAQFRVHIKTCSLTVSKQGASSADENQCFIFRVTGTSDTFNAYVNLTVVVQGSGSVTVCGLPVGTYTIIEDGAWSWRYECEGSKEAALSPECDTAGVTAINTRNHPYWLNGCSAAVNDFRENGVVRYTETPARKHR